MYIHVAMMSVMLSHHSGPVVVSAASNSHIVHYLAAEKINFKVHLSIIMTLQLYAFLSYPVSNQNF